MAAPAQNASGLANLDLLRARAASEAVNDVANLGEETQKKFRQLARSAPADIMTMGLGQTSAFWASSGKEHDQKMIEHVKGWLRTQALIQDQEVNLVDWVVAIDDMLTYRRATRETLAFLAWVKRFAEAKLDS